MNVTEAIEALTALSDADKPTVRPPWPPSRETWTGPWALDEPVGVLTLDHLRAAWITTEERALEDHYTAMWRKARGAWSDPALRKFAGVPADTRSLAELRAELDALHSRSAQGGTPE